MTWVAFVVIIALLGILLISSYIERLYTESGKFLSLGFQKNIEVWEREVEPRLGMKRERIGLSAALWSRLSLAALALCFGALLFAGAPSGQWPSNGEIAQAVLGTILVILIFSQFLPFVFSTRTRGRWVVPLRPVIALLFYALFPVTLFLGFLLSIAELAEPPAGKEEEELAEAAAVNALIEAGEEEGILTESDRDLVRSAVEFGDKVVREVMTPRPAIFAVPAEMMLSDFLAQLDQHPYSRVPVFHGTLDHITGIAFAHDLLHITDEEAAKQQVRSIVRAAVFIPETKRINELLREMQRQKQHMCIVIDEYGGVAGLVTIEDLLEEIVGNIRDEHEQDTDENAPLREPGGAWLVPGTLEMARLRELLGPGYDMEQEYRAATVAGLVSEIAGRIPLPGEVIVADSLRFEVVASTNRRIDRLRVSPVEH